ncbi:CRISPR-associated protein Cas4 [Endomicrobiia bacterium]|uniref:CRISPR-associated protein Cas4 n=1 Tax=Endomicrobium trichonymphae TaxID=1408204 RepID=UPI000865EF0F|nr:CRISPR-associated protein Cas4 [Candidatus Endomicrobium trichonymphae]GHT06616.1 CRISPR-associated protein Cas4 [Endomicrobiia bacterium]BAV58777.1 CRISPR-associated protein Cas4 [Candidatus Endomicrobium trichonymphae]GHT14567.1 CRISPR-associated protein Cas4 [Endomicrobiia bacterium]GHT20160.1 CRISPR-associated protein Cas4 [Endomicrobiia bacterium]GHT30390.1 CRISPR-associated protein Cas4 [Endomicrobiia bacterium]
MYCEDDLLHIRGVQQLSYCKRRCALLFIEQQWSDNFFTAKGIVMHDKAHVEKIEHKKGVVIERDIYLKSYELGLIGKSDVVEFHRSGNKLIPFPVEYKSGKAKSDNVDKVQLCAQALCLEEMMNVTIESGAIFYGKTRNRLNVEFNKSLREETFALAQEFHSLVDSRETPKPEYSKKCYNCSFEELCLPEIFDKQKSVKKYLKKIVNNEKTI